MQRGLRAPAQGLHEQRRAPGPHFDRRNPTFTTSTILVPLEQKKEVVLLESCAQLGHPLFALALNSPPELSLSSPATPAWIRSHLPCTLDGTHLERD